MKRGAKIVLLVGSGESSKIVYNYLVDYVEIDKVIEESTVPITLFLRRRLKRLGMRKVLGQILFSTINTLFIKRHSHARIQEIKSMYSLSTERYPDDVYLKVDSVNDCETIDLLKEINPDIILVNGTRIVSERVLGEVDAVFLNTHVGITPLYRGVHGGYWSIVNGDLGNCGVTVHLVDKGIDTGGVLYQSLIEVNSEDGFNTYPFLQLGEALPLILRAIDDIQKGNVIIKSHSDRISKLYTHPTLWEYLKYRVFRGVK